MADAARTHRNHAHGDAQRTCKLAALFTTLVQVHMEDCSLHDMVNNNTGVCVHCQSFECKVCQAKEPFVRHFLELAENRDGTTQDLDAWICETLAQWEKFAAVHHHGKVN